MLQAQKLNNQWRFGHNLGIDFNTATPSAVSSSAMYAIEGSASVADSITGQLLFYTDGVTVWNRNDQVMFNGNGLMSGSSSTTAAMICPRPGNSQQFYIFTIDQQGSSNGLRYSLVDMGLQGGLGAIVNGQKNILLHNTSSEKIQIIPHTNGHSLWILTHTPPNTFTAYLLNATGLSPAPVLSTLGSAHTQEFGHLKISKQFDRLAMGNFHQNTIELFDFDRNSGIVSNFRSWNFGFGLPPHYGVEFSPDGRRLYISNLTHLVQYNLLAGNTAAIQASGTVLNGGNLWTQVGGLQLGPDNRIYMANGSVDRINCPNELGTACDFVSNAIPNLGTGGFGFPNWVYRASDLPTFPIPNAIVLDDSCLENGSILRLLDTTNLIQAHWNLNDPGTPTNQQTGYSISHNFSRAGNFNITVVLEKNCGTADTLRLTVNMASCVITGITGIEFHGDTCTLLQPFHFTLTGNSAASNFHWKITRETDGTTDTLNLSNPRDTLAYVFGAPGNYSICVQYFEPSLGEREICRTFSFGTCCLFDLKDIRFCIDDSLRLRLSKGAPDSVRWLIEEDDITILGSGVFTPTLTEPGRFPLRAIAYRDLCITDTLDAMLQLVDCNLSRCTIFAPTAFTPQGDGLNDSFRPILGCSTVLYDLCIYNRWGTEVFRTVDPNASWNGQVDGQPAEQGVYQYILFYRLEIGETRQSSGSFRLLR